MASVVEDVQDEEIPMVAARTPNVAGASASLRRASANATKRGKPRRAPASWEARLQPDREPRVVDDVRRGRLLLPTPLLVAAAVGAIPRGRVMTIGQLRCALAERFGAAATCALTTGVIARVLAGVVVEDLAQRRKPRVPIWRLVRDDGTLHPNWPLDARYRATMLREEGVRLTRRNGHWAAIDTHDC